MSTTIIAPAPARSELAGSRTLGILAALGGRWAWRFWIATATWLIVGLSAAAWLNINQPRAEYGPLYYTALPAGLYLIGYLLAVVLIWVWGGKFALNLGHRRRAVFGWAWLVTLVLGGWVWFSTQLANHAELAIVGREAYRAFTVEAGDNKFGTETAILNASLLLIAIYLIPVLAVWVTILAGFVGRGLLGALMGLAVGLASLIFGMYVTSGVLDRFVPSIMNSNAGGLLLAGAIHVVICVAAGWLLFRQARA